MTGLDGINSLKTALSSLNVNDAAPAGATQAISGYSKGAQITAARTGSADRASFSAGALAAQAANAPDTSDVRLTKVAELRQAIASGTYNVPATAVADKMVEGLLG